MKKDPNSNSENYFFDVDFLDAVLPLKDFVFLSVLTVMIAGLFTFHLRESSPYINLLGWKQALANSLLIVLLLSSLGFYLLFRKNKVLKNKRLRDFLAIVTLIIVLFVKGANIVSPFLIPVAFGAALISLFIGAEVGLVMSIGFSFLIGIEGGFNSVIDPMVVSFLGALVGILGVQDIKRGFDLTKTGIAVGGVNMLAILCFQIPSLKMPYYSSVEWPQFGWAGINGLVSALFVAGAIPLAERMTQKTSPIGLMELLNPSHPLLERLREEAPGSYHHSKNIASLGENAARAIDADPLLTLVGGYYHDIGKMVRPEFFIENQTTGDNPHDELTPTMSKIILTSHIKQGIKLGKRYGLKEDILEFIPTHHGTSVIRYFYLKALREKREDVDLAKEEFLYDAELPKTKETSIIALADPVEAAARSLDEEMSKDVEQIVEEEIQKKIDQGQLDESPLTMDDIEKIKEEFVSTVIAMSHNRIENFPAIEG